MNKILLLLLMLCTLTTIGQIEIYNLSLTDSTKNILYRHTSNLIKISGIDKQSNVKLIANARFYCVDSTKNDLYFISPGLAKSDTLKVVINDNIIFTKQYDCLRVSDPIPLVANTKEVSVSRKQIKSFPYLSIILPDCLYKHDFYIVRFEVYFLLFDEDYLGSKERDFKNNSIGNCKLSYKKVDKSLVVGEVTELIDDSLYIENIETGVTKVKSRKIKSKQVFSPFLNKGHLAIIEEMQSGDMIIFKDILIRSADSSNQNIGSLIITIIE